MSVKVVVVMPRVCAQWSGLLGQRFPASTIPTVARVTPNALAVWVWVRPAAWRAPLRVWGVTGMLNVAVRACRWVGDGVVRPVSHADHVTRVTPIWFAAWVWVRPAVRRACRIDPISTPDTDRPVRFDVGRQCHRSDKYA